MKRNLFSLFVLVIFVSFIFGCKTHDTNLSLSEPLVFEDEKGIEINFEEIESLETEPPDFIFLKEVDIGKYIDCPEDEEPTHIAIVSEDFIKIETLVDVKNLYKNLSKEQYGIIKLQEKRIDLLKNLCKIEREARRSEERLKYSYEEAYKESVKQRNFDNIFYKVLLFISLIGHVF